MFLKGSSGEGKNMWKQAKKKGWRSWRERRDMPNKACFFETNALASSASFSAFLKMKQVLATRFFTHHVTHTKTSKTI
jgi:hypothetical protein